ncbi:zinc transporter ZIP6 [Anopheles bellator]|uniref:zinc transporter ZIP6 n=1 Tax=Anopheles bellator TaxID=139047 RepID=UPI00264795F3|nr:zinc transporter ZIP6 [Anopheles bellator]
MAQKFLTIPGARALLGLTVMLWLTSSGALEVGPAQRPPFTSTTPSESPAQSQPPQATADGENKFLKYLFNKYGSKGVISFEGLEHLMHSLGLGGLDFSGSHGLKEHRPEGYDFGDYDVYGGSKQPPSHRHDQDDSTPEPPVITFASTFPDTTGGHHHYPGHQHTNAASSGTAGPSSTVTTTTSTTTPGPTSTPSDEHQAPRDGDGDGRVWQEMIFKEIHDPRHRHPRNKNVPYCLSPMSIIHLVMEEPVLAKQHNHRRERSLAHNHAEDSDEHDLESLAGDARIEITPSEFKDLCPAFLVQLDQKACSLTQKLQKEGNPHREKKPFSQAWIYASACVLVISLCGLVGVAMVPLAKSIAYDEILRFLIALGVGTLCGDALMHLLPHALLPHDHHEHEHGDHHGPEHGSSPETRAMWLCLCTFGTAFFMYSLEMILPLFRDGDTHGHSHSHSSHSNRVEPRSAVAGPPGGHHHADDIELEHSEVTKEKEANTMLAKKSPRKPMTAVAFMVVLGDGLHNITDGLAIGAAFAIDPVTGLATSFAILCHELPHELGDFALLLQTGVSIRRAIFLNIVSSVLSFIGMALGLLLTGLHESVVSWIYAGTAGTFLYIALSDLVPEMRNDLANSEQKLKLISIQLAGLTLGAIIMLLIALNEEALQQLFD